jgi:hypothetical protein
MFSISSYPKVAPDPSPYTGVAPGEIIRFAPYRARCVQCNVEKTIFDPKSAGYRAFLKGDCADKSDETDPVSETGAATLYVCLGYRFELSELRTLAEKARVTPADLFEDIYIRGEAPNGRTIFEEHYECS